MRVLNLSLDRTIEDKKSLVAKRLAALSRAAGEVVVLVPRAGNKVHECIALWRRAAAVLSKSRCDLITVQDTAYLALLAYLLARRFTIPLEIQVHGFESRSLLRRILARFLLYRADAVRVVSNRLNLLLSTNYHLLSTKIYTLPVYTQIEAPREVQAKDHSVFSFLTVGRLVPVKNIGMQIHAFARLVKDSPNARLVIVGDGPELPNLQLSISDFQLQDKIILTGRQNDVSQYYKEADAFLLTSDSEGWGVAVTEAAAFGLPIIMTDVGLAGEFIKDGENGIVIPVGDEDALFSAMKRLVRDAGLRVRLGEAALRSFYALPRADEQIQKQVEAWRSLE